MNYVKAEKILPEDLLKEVQKYIQGQYLYIPAKPQARKKWGENSGHREYIRSRNEIIRSKYISGYKIQDLSEEFYLSIESIRKIVYSKNI